MGQISVSSAAVFILIIILIVLFWFNACKSNLNCYLKVRSNFPYIQLAAAAKLSATSSDCIHLKHHVLLSPK